MPFEKQSLVTVDIDDLAYGGAGVGRVDGFVVFVDRALPGDRVTARIIKKQKNHAQAVIHEIERPSPARIAEPPCPLFGECGGCTWQNLPYDEQLKWKEKQVADTLAHLGKQAGFVVSPIIASPTVWRYRNKMEYTFGYNRNNDPALGFHTPKRFDEIFRVPTCLIQPEAFDAMLGVLESYAREHRLEVYDPRRHDGFLRHAVMRYSQTTGEVILVLITQEGDLPAREALAAALREKVPGFKGMVWGIHCGVADVARIGEERWRTGEPELFETVNDLTFRISPQSFFQTNTAGAQILYAKTAELAELSPQDRVLDAYCGAGAIGLHCASQVESVVGIETVTEAIWDARDNARRNNITNATFIAAPLAEGLGLALRAPSAKGEFTRVIIDPPRGGMDKHSLRGLIDLRAPVFVYVSCNPATLARDLETISAAGYKIEVVQPVDMFPHTYHVETIVRMRLEATSRT